MTAAGAARKIIPNQQSLLSKLLVQQFSNKVVGQENATQTLVDILESHRAGFGDKTKPIGNALFLGPTGTGKTHVVETLAEALFDNKNACIRIDCAEFQHSHEIAKLVGSPPGYLGHRETHPALTQEALNQFHTESMKVSILLFDEIEKASDSLWSLLLGILDKASLTLGDNRKVDFSNTIIVMTSNLGTREMAKKDIGFNGVTEAYDDARLEAIAKSAAKSKFTPEFMNRLQHIVMFNTLTQAQIELILEIELQDLNTRIINASTAVPFKVAVSPKARLRLLAEGYDRDYGARHIKRAIRKLVEKPLAKMVNSGQIMNGDTIVVDEGENTFEFYVHP